MQTVIVTAYTEEYAAAAERLAHQAERFGHPVSATFN